MSSDGLAMHCPVLVSLLLDWPGSVSLLLDLNLHYRFLKFCHGKGYMWWRFRRDFCVCALLFAVWYAYKDGCMVAALQMLFLLHGGGRLGNHFPTTLHLRSIEMLFAAILLLVAMSSRGPSGQGIEPAEGSRATTTDPREARPWHGQASASPQNGAAVGEGGAST